MKSKLPVGRFNYEGKILEGETTINQLDLKYGITLKDVLFQSEVDTILNLYEKEDKIPVGLNGIVSDFKEGDKICSYRATLFSNSLATDLFARIKGHIPYQEGYEAIGINESFRFIDYKDSGVLIPHYDGEYRRDNGEVSLLTLVMYLKTTKNGRTQFVKENRKNHNFEDWDKMALPEDILETAENEERSALIFPHYTLHQGEETSDRKVILRTDIMFRKL